MLAARPARPRICRFAFGQRFLGEALVPGPCFGQVSLVVAAVKGLVLDASRQGWSDVQGQKWPAEVPLHHGIDRNRPRWSRLTLRHSRQSGEMRSSEDD